MREDVVRRIDAGMERRLEAVRAEQAQGLRRIGWKVAVNAPAVQKALGLDGWLVSPLPARRALHEPVFQIPAGARIHLEAEIAMCLGTSLPARVDRSEAADSIEAFAPAIELVDYALPASDLGAMAEHGFFHAGSWIGSAIGPFQAIGPRFPVVYRNGGRVAGAIPDQALHDPATIALGTAALLDRYDERLDGGDWILCGSLIEPVACEPGDVLTVDFGPMGPLEIRFEG